MQHLTNVGHCGTLPKQCSKHNHGSGIDFGGPSKKPDSCLKKSSNSDLNKGSTANIKESHLLTCQKSIPSIPKYSACKPKQQLYNNHDSSGQLKSSFVDSDCISSSASSASSCNIHYNASVPHKTNEQQDGNAGKRCTCGASKQGTVKNNLPAVNAQKKRILKNTFVSTLFSRSSSVREAKSVSSLDSSATTNTVADYLEMKRVRDRIAQADVFLEAIGNATTVKNYNSSRYVRLYYSYWFIWFVFAIWSLNYRENTLTLNLTSRETPSLVTWLIVSIVWNFNCYSFYNVFVFLCMLLKICWKRFNFAISYVFLLFNNTFLSCFSLG